VKEVRTAKGDVKYSATPRVIRRVMSPETAATMQQLLRDVVAGGTSTRADLLTLDVGGKSGTAKRTSKGQYVAGSYTASFVGLFPQDRPQYVILVKLDNPQNGYYGGVVAGSITNTVLRAALSARNASLDLHQLATSVHAPRPDTTAAGVARARAQARTDSIKRAAMPVERVAAPADTDPRTSASYVVKLPSTTRVAPIATAVRPVPDVAGLPLRAAVRTLHAAGFRVELVPGYGATTLPVAGTPWMPGRVVKLGTAQ
jgi:membrane peptidoglycan carboxypeptidase